MDTQNQKIQLQTVCDLAENDFSLIDPQHIFCKYPLVLTIHSDKIFVHNL